MRDGLEAGAIQVTTVEVKRDDFGASRVVTDLIFSPLDDAEILLKVDRLALTASVVGLPQVCNGWLRVDSACGSDDVCRSYQKVLFGKSDPATGHILSTSSGV
jgi:hypothetical protein